VVQRGLPIDENSFSAALALNCKPATYFILPNDQSQTCIPAAGMSRFADIRGNGHFDAWGDAIRHGPKRGSTAGWHKRSIGKKADGIKSL
jgi:hypothetical protein